MKNFSKLRALTLVICVFGGIAPIVALAAGPAAVNLGAAGNFAILAKTGVSSTGSTIVIGDVGLSPAAASYITGFALTLPSAGAFSTSALVSGKIYAPDYANPTPANLTTAVLDMQNAYTDAAGRPAGTTELGAGNIGGLTLAPGVYRWGTNVTIPTNVTLSGGAGDVWIFQIAGNLTVSSAAKVILSSGAQPGNVFWAVAGQTTIGTGAAFSGNILDQTTVVMNTSAQLNGRALAQAAVTLDSNSVAVPYTGMTSVTYNTPVYTPAQVYIPAAATPSNTAAPVAQSSAGLTYYQAGQSMPARDASGNLLVSAAPSASLSQQVKMITVDLREGSRNDHVMLLQQFLISQNTGQAARSLAATGATAYFGALTRAALAEFQAQAGISPALGNFGPMTRSYISAHY